MKRFYQKASAQKTDAGYGVVLDGRAIRTPVKALLEVPTLALAEAIADEWNAQGDKIDPRTMPLTGLANAAIDRVSPDPAHFAQSIAVFAESDLLAYRADHPAPLVARQNAVWDPIIDWARGRYDIVFLVTEGIIHQPQPEMTLQRLRAALSARTPFELSALYSVVTISGSLVIALALLEQAIDVETAWVAGHLDELWQVEQWGEDELAAKARAARRHDFEIGARFLELLR